VDCDERNPQWASVSLGVFMCLECSGRHRALGVHISFVRSVSMDSWSEKQIKMMRVGGNDKCNAFLAEHGVRKNTPIPQKYNTPAAMLYKVRRVDSACPWRLLVPARFHPFSCLLPGPGVGGCRGSPAAHAAAAGPRRLSLHRRPGLSPCGVPITYANTTRSPQIIPCVLICCHV